jgi:hypothetical protein
MSGGLRKKGRNHALNWARSCFNYHNASVVN